MIRALYESKTAEGALAPYAKIILDAKLRIEAFSFQFGFDIFTQDVAEYIKSLDERITLKDPKGNRIKGNGWLQLSQSDIAYMVANAQGLAVRKHDFNKIMSGEYARMVWAKVMDYLRYSADGSLDFSFIEETFEKMYKITAGGILVMNPTILTPVYESSELTDVIVSSDEILQTVRFTNTSETEQVMGITLDGNTAEETVPANSQKIKRVNILPPVDSAVSTTGAGEVELLVKCDDNSTYIIQA